MIQKVITRVFLLQIKKASVGNELTLDFKIPIIVSIKKM